MVYKHIAYLVRYTYILQRFRRLVKWLVIIVH